MSFLPASDYDAIRDDPSLVVSYYQSSQAQFLSALNMQGLSEDAQIAAWCTVVAYDLVPYGPGPQTTDLTQILHADTIACAHYVSLAWQLMTFFGISTNEETAVGWDDGAVGNHAELFFSDGISNLLLDPTIGLVVNGATLQGIISGEAYSEYASFYSREDITSFNSTVINAVTKGLYHIRDVIYDIPTLDNWLNHYSEFQGMTLDNEDGSQTIVGSLNDDHLAGTAFGDVIYGGKGNDVIDSAAGNDTIEGGKGDDSIDGGDGSDTVSYLAPRSSFTVTGTAIDATVTGGDASGADTLFNVEYLQFSDQILPLSAHVIAQADVDDVYPWSQNLTSFDGDWHRLQVAYSYEDGSQYIYQYDALAQFTWGSVETNFGDSGQRSQVIYNGDDGTKDVYQYDVDDTFNWASIQTSIDGSNHREEIIYSNDDATNVVYQYDTIDQFSWSSTARYFDSVGHKTKDVYDNDAGTHTVYEYDGDGKVTQVSHFDSGWHLLV
jgi:hypothetical protein